VLSRLLTARICAARAVATASAVPRPRNVVLMVADGGGYDAWLATAI